MLDRSVVAFDGASVATCKPLLHQGLVLMGLYCRMCEKRAEIASGESWGVVELASLPGAGKTTILEALRARDRESRFVIRLTSRLAPVAGPDWLSKSFGAAWAFGRYPALHFRLAIHGTMTRGFSLDLLRVVSYGGRFLDTLRLCQARARPRPVLLDQGLIQLVASVSTPLVRRVGAKQIEAITEKLICGRLQGVVWIDCPLQLATKRLSQRSHGTSRFDERKGPELAALLQEFRGVLESSLQTCEKLGIPVKVLRATDSPQTNAERLEGWILSLGTPKCVAANTGNPNL